MMKPRCVILLLLLSVGVSVSFGQATGPVPDKLSPAETDRIIKRFSSNETTFREALKDYVFNRSVSVTTVGLGGNFMGLYRRDSWMTFAADGSRLERILYFPLSTLTEITMTAEDLEDLGGVTPFSLEPSAIPQYNFSYVGSEKIDDIDLYVFDVTPKVIPDPKKTKLRLFTGRIWVDKDDPMIIRSKGKGVPETKTSRYPIVETTRLPVDKKYYFPVDARSDDTMVFDSGQVVKIRMRVTYSNYRVGRSDVRILDEDPTPTPTPSPTPKKPE